MPKTKLLDVEINEPKTATPIKVPSCLVVLNAAEAKPEFCDDRLAIIVIVEAGTDIAGEQPIKINGMIIYG